MTLPYDKKITLYGSKEMIKNWEEMFADSFIYKEYPIFNEEPIVKQNFKSGKQLRRERRKK